MVLNKLVVFKNANYSLSTIEVHKINSDDMSVAK